MSTETLEELKALRAGAPAGKTHVSQKDGDPSYWNEDDAAAYAYFGGDVIAEGLRALSDIDALVEAGEQRKAAYEAYARLETVKQGYNAENNQKATLLQEAAVLLRHGRQESCEELADQIEAIL